MLTCVCRVLLVVCAWRPCAGERVQGRVSAGAARGRGGRGGEAGAGGGRGGGRRRAGQAAEDAPCAHSWERRRGGASPSPAHLLLSLISPPSLGLRIPKPFLSRIRLRHVTGEGTGVPFWGGAQGRSEGGARWVGVQADEALGVGDRGARRKRE